jgi:hypothetical protein
MEIMWDSVSVDNCYTLLELVLQKINDIYKRTWKLEDFIQTDVYRPKKKNVKIHTFVEHQKEAGIDIKPNERFKYVIVKKYPYYYNHRGCKKELSVGDKMELVETAIEQKLEVDLDHYMKSSINGQLARLITYHQMFYVEPLDNTEDELHAAEVKIYKNAGKYIEEYCKNKNLYAGYNTLGKTYQSVFKRANKLISNQIKSKDPLIAELLSANVAFDKFEQWILDSTEKLAMKYCIGHGATIVNNMLDQLSTIHPTLNKAELAKLRNEKIGELQKVYYGKRNKSITAEREAKYQTRLNVLTRMLRDSLKDIIQIYKVYYAGVGNIVDNIKNSLSIDEDILQPVLGGKAKEYKLEDLLDKDITPTLDNDLELTAMTYTETMFNNPKLVESINNYKKIYYNIVAVQINNQQTISIVDYLKTMRDRMNRAIVRPNDRIMNTIIRAGIEDAMKNGLDF